MMRGTMRYAVAAALLAASATSLRAAEIDGPANNTVEIRVINNNASIVRVMVEDANGRQRSLGLVRPADFKVLEVPAEIAELGEIQIEVFPSEPVWSLTGGSDGVRTRGIKLALGDAVHFWVEPDLQRSMVEILRG